MAIFRRPKVEFPAKEQNLAGGTFSIRLSFPGKLLTSATVGELYHLGPGRCGLG